MNCKFCEGICHKAGKQKNGTQKFYCRACDKYQQSVYKYSGCKASVNSMIQGLLCEGLGIRSIGRIMGVCNNTVLTKIRQIAQSCHAPEVTSPGHEYEIDEMRSYIGNRKNECWLTYCITRHTKQVIAFAAGKRTRECIRQVTDRALATLPKAVYTDGLLLYRSLLPRNVHRTGHYCTNAIERVNLDLRTHIKRLSRRTICYSKSIELMEACIRIYFWRSCEE